MMTLEEKEFLSPLASTIERLKILLRISERIDSDPVALSYPEVGELLLDLGLLLRNARSEQSRGSEVFEDPLNRGDALGNVRMITRRLASDETPLMNKLGEALIWMTHDFLWATQTKQKVEFEQESADYFLDEFEVVACEDSLKAKRLLRSLKMENRRLDYRNESLWIQNEKLKEKYLGLESIFAAYTALCSKAQISLPFHVVGESRLKHNSLEKKSDSVLENAQTNCLSWDADGETK